MEQAKNMSIFLKHFCIALLLVVLTSVDYTKGSTTWNGHNPELVKLFSRQSLENKYPAQDIPGPAPRTEWLEALNTQRQAGRIPSFQPSIRTPNEGVKYAAGLNGSDPNTVCSWTIGCKSPNDINDAPAGMMGVSFDDGPTPASPELMNFLKSVNQTVTHFMIGSRILQYPNAFATALQQGGHIAVHTWSHPLMTTLNDTAVVGELGWTLQIIFDLSGGRLPAFWRPPYGDVDNRVRAIAKNVFGLQTVIWNQDTNDWCLTPQDTNTCGAEGPENEAALRAEMSRLISMPKNPGLIILEHELTSHSVHGFTTAWPQIKRAGWDTRAIPALFNMSWYQNADGASDPVIPLNGLIGASQVVTNARARLAEVSNNNFSNSTNNSTAPGTLSSIPPQVRGSQSGASRQVQTLRNKVFIFFQFMLLASV